MPIQQQGGEQGEKVVDIFWYDIVTEIERDRIQQVKVHRVIRERDLWNLVDAAVLEPQFGDEKMVGESIPVNGRHGTEDNGGDNQGKQQQDQPPGQGLFR